MDEIRNVPVYKTHLTMESVVGKKWKMIVVSKRAAKFMIWASAKGQWKRPVVQFTKNVPWIPSYHFVALNLYAGILITVYVPNHYSSSIESLLRIIKDQLPKV